MQAQESHVLNSSSNSLKKSFKANNLEKKEKEKEKEEESDIEYDDVYVVEERTIPTAEIDNQDDEDLNEELSLSLSSEDDNFEIIGSDYDKIKLASEKSKIKLERKKDKERLDKIMEEKVDFVPKTIKKDKDSLKYKQKGSNKKKKNKQHNVDLKTRNIQKHKVFSEKGTEEDTNKFSNIQKFKNLNSFSQKNINQTKRNNSNSMFIDINYKIDTENNILNIDNRMNKKEQLRL